MSKRKEEKREQEYYRKKIGEKLEEAYLSIPMGEPPSEETIKKWIQIADQKRAQRLKRKRILLSSAAAVVLCAGVCATCILHTPEAVAGNSGEVKIEMGMDSKEQYNSEDSVPEEIKKEFLWFDYIPNDFAFSVARVERVENLSTLQIFYENQANHSIEIKEIEVEDETFALSNLSSDTLKENWNGLEIYVKSYYTGERATVYSYIHEKMLIEITVPENFDKSEIQKMLEKAVRD